MSPEQLVVLGEEKRWQMRDVGGYTYSIIPAEQGPGFEQFSFQAGSVIDGGFVGVSGDVPSCFQGYWAWYEFCRFPDIFEGSARPLLRAQIEIELLNVARIRLETTDFERLVSLRGAFFAASWREAKRHGAAGPLLRELRGAGLVVTKAAVAIRSGQQQVIDGRRVTQARANDVIVPADLFL
jgi:hypothetical protein